MDGIDTFNAGSGIGGNFYPLLIFVLVAALQLFDSSIQLLKKRGAIDSEQIQLRKEISELLKEASSLSTPSTFAQSAKLKRLAAAKEKELTKKKEERKKENQGSYELHTRALLALKILFYGGFIFYSWGVPVAVVPQHVLQPLGRVLSWKTGNAATGQIMVGMIPWLVLTSRVNKFLCQKLFNRFFS